MPLPCNEGWRHAQDLRSRVQGPRGPPGPRPPVRLRFGDRREFRGRCPVGRLARDAAPLGRPGPGRRRHPAGGYHRRGRGDPPAQGRGQAAAGGQRDPQGRLDFLRGRARLPQPLIMAFIDQLRARGFAVGSICQVLGNQGVQVAARTYRSWKAPGRQVAARTVCDAVVSNALLEARVGPDGRPTPESLYGRRKMTALLRRRGLAVAHCTVDRLMRELGMQGVRRGKTPRTTIPGKDSTRAGDLLDRDFTAPAPNRVWIADFTYVRAWTGMGYVAFVVDVYAQRIVGWHAMSTRPAELVLLPLRMAAWARGQQGHPIVRGELVHHSDAGSQYLAIRFTEHLQLEGITPSVGSVGDAYDNALMESIIGLYKTECVRPGPFHAGPFKTLSEVEFATMAWVDWYNHRRLHATLGMVTPAEREAAYYAALHPEPQPV